MKHEPKKLGDICAALNLPCPEGKESQWIHGVAPLQEAGPEELSFLSNPKYTAQAIHSQAGVILCSPKDELDASAATLLRVANPYLAFAQYLTWIESEQNSTTGVHPTALVAPTAEVHPTATIGAGAIVESGVRIGAHSYIAAGAQILKDSKLGENVRIESGAVIGSEGFGWAPDGRGGYVRIPQLGNVVLENDVAVGANSTIDRAVLGSTVVEEGVKIDNLCQIAHNVRIGAHTVIAAQTGIAGSTTIGKHCMIGGQVGIVGHLTIGDRVNIVAQSGVMSDVPSNKTIFGSPALDRRHFLKSYAAFKKLGE